MNTEYAFTDNEYVFACLVAKSCYTEVKLNDGTLEKELLNKGVPRERLSDFINFAEEVVCFTTRKNYWHIPENASFVFTDTIAECRIGGADGMPDFTLLEEIS